MKGPRRFTLTVAAATREIRRRALDSSAVALTQHAMDQMEARDIIAPELYRILREGTVREAPVPVADGWKAVMELRMPGGSDAAAVTVIVGAAGAPAGGPAGGLRVVTVMWRDPA